MAIKMCRMGKIIVQMFGLQGLGNMIIKTLRV